MLSGISRTDKRKRYCLQKLLPLPAMLLVLAFCLACILPQTADAKTFKQGDTDWKIKVAQQKLQTLGYQKTPPSSKLTAQAAEALKAFQKDSRLKATGSLDDKTYSRLTWQAFVQKEGIAGVQGRSIVAQAAKYKGAPYKFGGTSAKGFDCSGYVQYVFKQNKASLPRSADQQVLKGVFLTQKKLKAGDLVFFTTYAPGASHVGIADGKGRFWHVSSSKGVMLSSLSESYWKQRYYGARRVLIENGEI